MSTPVRAYLANDGGSISASNPMPVSQAAGTTGGATPYFDADGDNTSQEIKPTAGSLYFLEVSNPNATAAYIQLFDAATVTVGTTTPKLSLYVPPSGAMDKVFSVPLAFATAIRYACTTTPTDAGDPTIGLVVNAGFK